MDKSKPGPKPSGELPMVPVSVMFSEDEIKLINAMRGQTTKSAFIGNTFRDAVDMSKLLKELRARRQKASENA